MIGLLRDAQVVGYRVGKYPIALVVRSVKLINICPIWNGWKDIENYQADKNIIRQELVKHL